MTPTAHRQLVTIAIDGTQVEGTLALPVAPSCMILFAHGSGSSRHSPRNNAVAAELRSAGMGTLLMDLLGPEEDHDTACRFDIGLLTRRLGAAADWLADNVATRALPLGLFGASTGAAAALALAAQRGPAIGALVSRGGRPELVGPHVLAAVRSPVLLIVGGSIPKSPRSTSSLMPSSAVKNRWRWCPAPPICSRSPGGSALWRAWPRAGSCATCRRAESPCLAYVDHGRAGHRLQLRRRQLEHRVRMACRSPHAGKVH